MMTEKLIRDGKVAVLISPGFGAGWSTWGSGLAEMLLFDREIVEAVLAEDRKLAAEIAKRKAGDEYLYTGGADDLEVEWLPVGTAFEVDEYDGSESLRTVADLCWVA